VVATSARRVTSPRRPSNPRGLLGNPMARDFEHRGRRVVYLGVGETLLRVLKDIDSES